MFPGRMISMDMFEKAFLSKQMHKCNHRDCEAKFWTLQDLERHRLVAHVFKIKPVI